jgi:hypothetical protein
MAAVSLGLAPVLDRFSLTAIESDARWQVFIDARLAGLDLFPAGAGPGAFPFAFPASQSLELGWAFVNRAHNDYLEWFYDLGVGAVILLCLTGLIYLSQWARLLAESRTGTADLRPGGLWDRRLRVGAARDRGLQPANSSEPGRVCPTAIGFSLSSRSARGFSHTKIAATFHAGLGTGA